MGADKAFWQKHPGLVWSNPQADDAVFIRAALVRPQFERLLDVVSEFGFDRVRAEWDYLLEQPTTEVERARPIVDRILKNIATGFAIASRKN